jgi:hypothetical protein
MLRWRGLRESNTPADELSKIGLADGLSWPGFNVRGIIMNRWGLIWAAVLLCGFAQAFAQGVPPAYQPAPPPGVTYLPSAPPAEIVGIRPPRPDRRSIWVWHKGHWRWDGRAYVWLPGHWAERPPHMAKWVPPHWKHRRHGWTLVEGHWR